MNNNYQIEKRKKEIHDLVGQFENEFHLRIIIEILRSMLKLIQNGQLRD